MTLLKRKRVLAAKIETTPGTAIALTGTDAVFNCWDIKIDPDIEMVERMGQGGFGMIASVPGGYKGKATFKTDLNWDSSSTEPAWADAFFPACGLVKSGGNQFYPTTEAPGSNVKTLTIGCYIDGKFHSICGAVGTFKLVCPTGKMAYIEWEFTGIWVTPTDVAIISPTYPTAPAMRCGTGTTQWNSVTLFAESLTLDCGNEITIRESSTASGYVAGIITDRKPKVTANPEAKLVATADRYGSLLAMTESTLTWDIPGPLVITTAGKITIAAPKAQVVKISDGDRNSLVTDEIEFQLNKNASTIDREFSILFTPGT